MNAGNANVAYRGAICAGCERNKGGTCSESGATLATLVTLPAAACPVGRWWQLRSIVTINDLTVSIPVVV